MSPHLSPPGPARPRPPRVVGTVTVLGLLSTTVLAVLGFLVKKQCLGPTYDQQGRTPLSVERLTGDLCYTDVQALWGLRELWTHRFPYVDGAFVPPASLTGGTLEYPVLTGFLIWLTSLPVRTDGGMVTLTFVLMLACALVLTALLFRVAGRRAWLFALSPGLVLYTAYNWDMIPALLTTVAIAVVIAGPTDWPPRRRAVVAAVLLGLGGAFKLYPVMFVLPLALWVLTVDDEDDSRRPLSRALAVVGAGAAAFVLPNVPFMVAGFDGWLAAFQFQAQRRIDGGTQSIWYWAFQPASETGDANVQDVLMTASTVATAVGVLIPPAVGWFLQRRSGVYPWVQVCASMLCAYLVLNKVHSPQYLLWLIPFFVLIKVDVRWVLAYYVADICVLVGYYRSFYYALSGVPVSWANQALAIGVWGRVALLLCLGVAFMTAPLTRPRWQSAPTGGGRPRPVQGGTVRPAAGLRPS